MSASPNPPSPPPPEDRPSKQAAFQTFLQEGFVSIHLDARRTGVVVPSEFSRSPHLVLQYGLNMPIPIPDLEVTDDGVSATLSFARQPQRTIIPWTAIYIVACEDGRGVLYYEDVPEEVSLVARPLGSASLQQETQGETAEVALGKPDGEGSTSAELRRLKSVPLEADAPSDEEPSNLGEDDAAKKRRRRPTLKLVK